MSPILPLFRYNRKSYPPYPSLFVWIVSPIHNLSCQLSWRRRTNTITRRPTHGSVTACFPPKFRARLIRVQPLPVRRRELMMELADASTCPNCLDFCFHVVFLVPVGYSLVFMATGCLNLFLTTYMATQHITPLCRQRLQVIHRPFLMQLHKTPSVPPNRGKSYEYSASIYYIKINICITSSIPRHILLNVSKQLQISPLRTVLRGTPMQPPLEHMRARRHT